MLVKFLEIRRIISTRTSGLSVFRKNKNAIKQDIIAETGYSSGSIDRTIRLLKNKELIKRIGANKNGYWEVLH